MSAVLESPPNVDPLPLALDALLRGGLFDIHFQPIVDVERASILGFEALAREPADSPLHSPLGARCSAFASSGCRARCS